MERRPRRRLFLLADADGRDPGRFAHAGRVQPHMALPDDEFERFAAQAEAVASIVRDETGRETAVHPHAAGWIETPDAVARF